MKFWTYWNSFIPYANKFSKFTSIFSMKNNFVCDPWQILYPSYGDNKLLGQYKNNNKVDLNTLEVLH